MAVVSLFQRLPLGFTLRGAWMMVEMGRYTAQGQQGGAGPWRSVGAASSEVERASMFVAVTSRAAQARAQRI